MGVGKFLGGIPLIGGATKSVYDAGMGVLGDAGEGVEGLANDYMNVGKNRYQPKDFGIPDINYGGEYGAQGLADVGLAASAQQRGAGNYFQGQAMGDRGPQAIENQELSDRESGARYGDQNGAIQLAREAAMGQAPSEAAFMMQRGLDQGINNQSAMAAGARGSAGLALAGSGAAANIGQMQNQAFTAAGQMRAGEMANARGQYGQLAQGQREQDLQRLGQGNQMGQFNAGLNDQYRLGMGGLSNQTNNNALGWYQAAQNPFQQDLQGQTARAQIGSENFNQAQAQASGINQANTDARRAQTQQLYGLGGSVVNTGGQMLAGQMGGSKVPPKA